MALRQRRFFRPFGRFGSAPHASPQTSLRLLLSRAESSSLVDRVIVKSMLNNFRRVVQPIEGSNFRTPTPIDLTPRRHVPKRTMC